MEVCSSCLGMHTGSQDGRLPRKVSQGKGGPGTGDFAIAALNPTQLASQVTGCPEFEEDLGPCGVPPFLGMRPWPSLQTHFTKQRELWAGAGLSNQRGPRLPGSSHISQEHILALVYNAVRYINQ